MQKIIIVLFLFLGVELCAQDYNFTVSTGNYQNLSNNISLNNGTVWDDPSYAIPIGFNFHTDTNSFDTIYIDGQGGTLISNQDQQGIGTLIMPIGQDLHDLGAFTNVSQSNISYKLVGQPGSRILKIEWQNAGFFGDSTLQDYVNFQVWFFEINYNIEYHFGPSSVNNPQSFEGGSGPRVAFFPSLNWDTGQMAQTAYFLTGDPINPNVIEINSSSDPFTGTLSGMIPNGTIYKFDPDNLAVEEMEKTNFVIYPNPTSDYLNIRFKENPIQEYQIIIYNSLGQKIKYFSTGKKNHFDISNLPRGLYFVELKNKEQKRVQKFVKK